MKYFKDTGERVHALDSLDFLALLPAGSVEVSEAAAMELLVPPPKTQAETDAEDSAAAKAELAALDLASIRSIREYIAAKPDAPQILKDKEAAAALARARVRP
jgi:hypothetical protein